MSAIPKAKWGLVKKLYLSGLPMRDVALRLNVSLDAVTYVLRRSSVPRRSLKEASRLTFEAKAPSFIIRKSRNVLRHEMELIGAMLYWAEGYKRETASGVDFRRAKVIFFRVSLLRPESCEDHPVLVEEARSIGISFSSFVQKAGP